MVSLTFNGISNAVSKVAEFVTPKQGQKVGFITHATAALVTAVVAATDPFFAMQLAGNYVLGAFLYNAGVEQNSAQDARVTEDPVRPVQVPVDDHKHGQDVGERLVGEGPTALEMLRNNPYLSDQEKLQIMQLSPEQYR